jgi:hypothetical protein
MPTLRPAIKTDDNYLEKIIKYIPAEIIAAYTALIGYLSLGPNSEIPPHYKSYYLIVLFILLLITPIWTFYAVIDNDDPPDPIKRKKKALFHSCVASTAFLIWVYALGNPLLRAILCKCSNTSCDNCGIYSPILGSILLILFTVLAPLFERIILGPKPKIIEEKLRRAE